MQQYKITLTTLSNVLTGSGKSSTLIDADVEFHKSGFPFIRARTLKGLLKESVEEVCEIENIPETPNVLDYLFGTSGRNEISAKLRFDNLYIHNWENLKSQVRHAKLTSSQIINHYTNTLQQTAIDENELAKDTSLRTYRVLKQNIIFEGILEVNGNQYEDLLNKAIINLRYAGTRRNRGLGRIRLDKTEIQGESKNQGLIRITDQTRLSVSLTTKHPLILSLQQGDQNSVSTQRYLSGNQLRGLIIGMYLKKNGNNPDMNEFYELFISGKIKFNFLYYNNARPLQLNIHYKKSDPKENHKPVNIFNTVNEITKPYSGMVSVSGNELIKEIPGTTLFFHNSRPDRTAGKSTTTSDAGGIFYYEAIDEDQRFEGSIEGDTETLKKLARYLPLNFETIIGRSRSAQYGKTELILAPVTNTNSVLTTEPGGEYIIKLETALILFNEFGFPESSAKTFLKALKIFIDTDDVEKLAAAFTKVEQYNQKWECKSGKMDAFKEGSVFVIKAKNITSIAKEFHMGQWNEQGYGKCTIEKYDWEYLPVIREKRKPAPDLNFEITHPELKKIIKITVDEESLLGLKTNALNLVPRFKGLKNHLIGRLIFAFLNKQTKGAFEEFIKKLQGKPAGEALKKKRLCTPDGDFKLDMVGDSDYPMQRKAWLLLLETLRKLNKKEYANNES